jgi:PAS domain S-box-containing protein
VDERSESDALGDREDFWASALDAAASVARQAAFSENDVLRTVTEELRRLRLRGGVSLFRPDGRLQVRTRSLSQSADAALQRLSGRSIEGYTFDPQEVDMYRQALAKGAAVFAPDRGETVRQMTPGPLKHLLPLVVRLLGRDPLIVAPLMLSGEPIGAINVSARWLSSRDLPMMTALANHIAISLGNARSQENLQRALEREQLRHQVVEAVTSALDLPRVLERVLRLAAEMTDADAGAVAVLDPTQRRLEYPYTFGLPPIPPDTTAGSPEAVAWKVIRTAQPVLLPDYSAYPEAAPAWLKAGLRALLGVPIMIGERASGAMVLFAKRPQFAFSHDQVETVSTIARLAAIGIENARLYMQATQRAEESQALIQTARSISSSLELQTTLNLIAEQAKALLKSDGSRIHLFDATKGLLHCVVALHPDAEAVMCMRVPPGTGLTGSVFQSGTPVIVNDPHDFPNAVHVPGTPEDEPEVLALVPLLFRDQPIGVMTVLRFSMEVPYTPDDVHLLSAFAAHAAIAIENARLYTQATHRAEESQALIQTARSISASLELQTVLNLIAEQAKALLKSDGSRIHLFDPHQGVLRCVVALHPDAEALMAVHFTPGVGLTGTVFQTGKPILVNDPHDFPMAVHIPGTAEDEPEVLALVPLLIRQRTIGVMTVLRFSTEVPYTDDDVNLLSAFAAHAAIAIENADLYGQIASQAHTLEAEVARRTAQLAESEARYRSLVETSVAGVFQCDAEGRVVYANQAFLEQAGLPAERLIGHVLLDMFPEDQRQLIGERFRSRLRGELPKHEVYEIEYTRPNGSVLYALAATSVIAPPGIGAQGLMGMVLDVSDRKSLEAALQTERDRLRAILANIGDAVMVADLNQKLEYVNPAWERLHGFEAGEAIGQPASVVRSDRHPAELYHDIDDAIHEGRTWRGELINRRKDGSTYDAAVTITPVLSDSGEVINYVGVQYDISALKELDRLKSQFVSDVSHELRTPLTNIRLYLDLLRDTGDRNKTTSYLDTLTRESERLAHLIDDLLSLSRLEARATPLNAAPVDLSQLLAALVQDRSTLAAKRGLLLDLQCEPDLPPALGDQRLLTQVFTNLLTNAMNYTPDGGRITLSTYHRATAQGDWIVGEVRDTGPGIPPEEQPLLFRRFFRGRASHRTGASGTGLGLAICKEIAELHGGRITLDSDGIPGHGSAFAVWLPTLMPPPAAP